MNTLNTTEIYKDIKGYEGLYQISNLGNVKSLSRKIFNGRGYYIRKEMIIKAGKDKDGYLYVQLSKDNIAKPHKVHRLVAETFIPNPENLPQVNHKDEVKNNNIVENLEWCTAKYNINYGTLKERFKFRKNKPVMCVETGEVYNSACEIKRVLGFDVGYIGVACKNNNAAYGYHWKYVS